MIIGFDLDNTIICYDSLFHKVALEQGLISPTTAKTKESVKSEIFSKFGEERWTALQGVVYGTRLLEADPFPGFLETIEWLRARNSPFVIVSHKTRYPIIGPKIDLHEAARGWLLHHKVFSSPKTLEVYFEETRKEKVARIKALGCTLFVDDLPEVFIEPGFDKNIRPILFDPASHHTGVSYTCTRSWLEVLSLIKKCF